MQINRTLLVGVYVAIALYFLYKLLFRKNTFQNEYEKLYNEVLTSNKYKVKGQYDKEE